MRSLTIVVLGALLILGYCAGCSKERNKTPEQVNNDVIALLQQNEVSKAFEMAESALQKSVKKNGAEHPSTAAYLQTMAMVYSAMGDSEKAESNYNQALSIIAKTEGKDSVEAAKILNNLASLFYSKKNYEKSIFYFKQSLEIAEKKFAADDPRIEAIRNNIRACEAGTSSGNPLQSGETNKAANPIQDFVPVQVKEAALSKLSSQNIIISGLQPQPPINMDDKGMIFPYIALKKGGKGDDKAVGEKIVVLFAAKKKENEQNKYIFQQCRIMPFQSYMSKMNEGGVELLKRELMKVFPGIYS